VHLSDTDEDGLQVRTLKVYLYFVKEGPVGPRNIGRGSDLTSPSVAYRHLQKLEKRIYKPKMSTATKSKKGEN
jgi:hypothetical protein